MYMSQENMGIHQEIERKFLVVGEGYKTEAYNSTPIMQGYISRSPGRTVRVRIRGDKGYLTIKGGGSASGMSRLEWEKEIPVEEALQLMRLCEPGIIDKTRHLVKAGDHVFEVDEFHGDNAGLVVAEVELGSEDEEFERPAWLGEEVTGDRRYYNSSLTKCPYCEWGGDSAE